MVSVGGAWPGRGGVAALLVLCAVPLAAQTPVTSLGLGYPVPPIDGRAAAMGGTGIGLLGGSFSSRNPADLNLFSAPALGGTLAPEGADVKTSEGSRATSRSRFVLIQAVLPVRSWTLGFNVNAQLDQDWDVLLEDTLKTSFGDYPFLESRQHDGGVSSIGAAVARRLGPIGIGVEGSVLTGQLRQVFRRNFEPALDDPTNIIGGALGESRWAFRGWRVRGGTMVQLGDRAAVSAALTVYGDLKADRDTLGARVETRSFDMPVEFAAGGSARLGRRLLVTAGGGWQSWSDTGFKVLDVESGDVLWGGAGLEYTGLRLLGVPVPVRAGYRFADLPFYPKGFEQLDETAFTFGFGGWIAGGRATLDLGIELGSRGELGRTGAAESFQRFSMSMGIVTR